MSLNQYAAERRLRIFDELRAGRSPSEGSFDEAVLREARAKGQPQMGSTTYAPDAILFEFIYPNPTGAPILLEVRLDPPERIVFMPVPSWVVESIWQGEISGSAHFESDAYAMLETFRQSLEPDRNSEQFEARPAIGRG
ncbi:hypothetical protein [Fimbriimonas ginsengisoli]|uniref:Uncharacterized protein n=1 Tax=Fimbriimonas ginsengisoli Gsoil 348 TaxID=661478 RepID=A0A068NR55_FIMGI|nr:hypothetical protein [Fimbriimonas ginsengisoli]AIE85245.1 hypothetical protein OP10G_1877 [Fimbriimonas ginsengisoli Gsoil 348]